MKKSYVSAILPWVFVLISIGITWRSYNEDRKRTERCSLQEVALISLGMILYEDRNDALPTNIFCKKTGKALLSWRVRILPDLHEEELYDQFHLDEPWDSPHNKKLIEKIPSYFESFRSSAEKGKTTYLAPVGKGTLFDTVLEEFKLTKKEDEPCNTVLVVDVEDESAVVWTKPEDLDFDPDNPKAHLRHTKLLDGRCCVSAGMGFEVSPDYPRVAKYLDLREDDETLCRWFLRDDDKPVERPGP